MYVKLPAKGGGAIPYEKRSVFERQFNFLRFVRGGTSRCPNIHTNIHTYILNSSFKKDRVSKYTCGSLGYESQVESVLKLNVALALAACAFIVVACTGLLGSGSLNSYYSPGFTIPDRCHHQTFLAA